jgi:PiT family inorganic phosphate transporter
MGDGRLRPLRAAFADSIGSIAAILRASFPVRLVIYLSGKRRHHGGNGSGLQMATVRNLLLAWVLTLPAAIALSASLYILFLNIV